MAWKKHTKKKWIILDNVSVHNSNYRVSQKFYNIYNENPWI